MSEEQTITRTLHRPFTYQRWAGFEKGHEVVTLPAGTVIRIGQFGQLLDYPDAISVNRIKLDFAAAKVCCPYVGIDSDGDDYRWVTFMVCKRFDGGEHRHCEFCRGDAMRCPSSRVRAEATKEEKHG